MKPYKKRNYEFEKYSEFMDRFKIELGDFLNIAEKCKKTNSSVINLKSRRKSIHIRDLLKRFRQISLENQKYKE